MRFTLIMLFCFVFYSFSAESTTVTSHMDKNKVYGKLGMVNPVENFKERVNFNQLIASEDLRTQVHANWRQLTLSPVAQGLIVGGPKASVSTLAFDKDQTRFEWEFLRAGAAVVSVDVVDALTSAGAQKRFMANAENNSMMDIPYVKGPADLGTVSAISKNDTLAGHSQLFWIYRNMYFEINVRGNFDRMALAHIIQKYAENNLQPPR